jgi:hypothetical protein
LAAVPSAFKTRVSDLWSLHRKERRKQEGKRTLIFAMGFLTVLEPSMISGRYT